MSALPGRPARVEAETATETEFGGRLSVWAEIGRLWVDLTPGAERDLAAADAPPLRIATATAVARDDVRVAHGQRLTLGDEPPWTVASVVRRQPEPGRMTLRLER